ncbi:efflux RND transporter periplasmic adaptor subunit [Marinifilum sp. N1E240]|uniref:efflux RND transporter periplasmic adaptor subunit n=1 Tax=Marinifilum sp. N1E240 TaxID=2608082 RepID=UPI00128CE985|nr:efflux RND transporter periplasmic adaptor subunit [Marinifilum sp. N1E240]MPQ46057.1 efflux RND transporter periplasmic adaptor subunit [Marinifilum sp. N1E240]
MTTKKISKLVLLLGIFATGFISCKKEPNTKVELIQPVKIFKVGNSNGNSAVKVFTGLVKESREVKLAFQIPGPLVGLNVDQGQFVKKGELIAAVNERDYLVQLEAACAQFDNAKLQAERYAVLYQKKSTSKSVFDQMQAVFKLAKAQKSAAENALKDTKIYAPFSGYVQAMYAENYEKVGAGQPIVSLLDLNSLEIAVSLSENDFLQKKSFVGYTAKFENFPGIDFDLKLIEIEQKPNGDNFFRMRLEIDRQGFQIVPGMVASIETKLASNFSTTCKVPVEAVFNKKGKSYVWIYDNTNMCVKEKVVRLKDFDSNGMINIESGIKNGDLIVSAGVHSLREGQKVKMLSKKANSNIGGQL